jgi:hypothetical protein
MIELTEKAAAELAAILARKGAPAGRYGRASR